MPSSKFLNSVDIAGNETVSGSETVAVNLNVGGNFMVSGVTNAATVNSTVLNTLCCMNTHSLNVSGALNVIGNATASYFHGTLVDWMTLVRGYKNLPVLTATIAGGDVYSYVYDSVPSNVVYYRYIATDGSQDVFYSYFSGSTLSGLIASKSITL